MLVRDRHKTTAKGEVSHRKLNTRMASSDLARSGSQLPSLISLFSIVDEVSSSCHPFSQILSEQGLLRRSLLLAEILGSCDTGCRSIFCLKSQASASSLSFIPFCQNTVPIRVSSSGSSSLCSVNLWIQGSCTLSVPFMPRYYTHTFVASHVYSQSFIHHMFDHVFQFLRIDRELE